MLSSPVSAVVPHTAWTSLDESLGLCAFQTRRPSLSHAWRAPMVMMRLVIVRHVLAACIMELLRACKARPSPECLIHCHECCTAPPPRQSRAFPPYAPHSAWAAPRSCSEQQHRQQVQSPQAASPSSSCRIVAAPAAGHSTQRRSPRTEARQPGERPHTHPVALSPAAPPHLLEQPRQQQHPRRGQWRQHPLPTASAAAMGAAAARRYRGRRTWRWRGRSPGRSPTQQSRRGCPPSWPG